MQLRHMSRNEETVPKGTTADYIRQPWRLCSLVYQAKFLKIEVLLFFYMFARFFYLPLYEQYYFHRFGLQLLQNTSFVFPNESTSFCLNSSVINDYVGKDGHKIVEKYSNNLVLYGQIAGRIPAMIVVLIMGPLSDRFGRKPVLIASLFGVTLQGITAVFIIIFRLNPYYFILGNFLTGIFGNFTGLLAGSFSYIADISSRKWRTFRIGVIEGMLAIGGALGQFLSGYWLNVNQCDFTPPIWLDLACCLAALLWVIFLLPESLSKEERLEKVAKKPKGLKSVMEGIKMFAGRMPRYSAWKLWAALLMVTLPLFNAEGSILVTLYFLKAPPFDLSPMAIGAFQGLQSLSRAASVTVLLVVFSIGLRMSDGLSALVGLIFQLAANILMGFAKTSTQIFVIAVVQGVEAISWAAGRSLMSKLVLVEDQGALFSIVASFQSMSSLISSVLWPLLFPLTLQQPNLTSGFMYFVMAGLDVVGLPLVIALILAEVCHRVMGKKSKSEKNCNKSVFAVDGLVKDRLLDRGRYRSYSSPLIGSINIAN